MNRHGVSIVIVSYNTCRLMEKCIESLMTQIDLNLDEIHVVDNNSSDGTVSMLKEKYPHVKIHQNENNFGFSYACNVGFSASTREFILITNSDIRFPKGSIGQMREKILEDPKIGIISPELIGEDGKLDQMTWGWDISLLGEMKQRFFAPRKVSKSKFINSYVSRLQKEERDVQIVAGACMMCRRSALNKVGGFDEGYELYFEDADLCLRLRQAGYKIRFTPNIKVIHGLGQSGKSNPQKISLIYRQSQISYYKKHHSFLKLFLLKIYLIIKFMFHVKTWKNSKFRRYILKIIFERDRIKLSDPIELQ